MMPSSLGRAVPCPALMATSQKKASSSEGQTIVTAESPGTWIVPNTVCSSKLLLLLQPRPGGLDMQRKDFCRCPNRAAPPVDSVIRV